MGINLEFAHGEGPVIHNPVRAGADVDRLREIEDVGSLDFVAKRSGKLASHCVTIYHL